MFQVQKSLISLGLIASFAFLGVLPKTYGDTAKKTDKVPTKEDKSVAKKEISKKDKKMIAVMETNKGTVKFELFRELAPLAVDNFVGLAEGTKEWTDPTSKKKVKKPYYDGLIFHRVIPNFVIQGGDPLGNGRGGPGFQFEVTTSTLRHDKPGVVAMANAGPGTNGSQFYITVAKLPSLDDPRNGAYTIFGQVIEGQDVVDAISKTRTVSEKPVEDMVIKKVTIERK
ncbi:MAG: peptidylprolyl isomerase [Pseudobdellovibrionaceae bacterium]